MIKEIQFEKASKTFQFFKTNPFDFKVISEEDSTFDVLKESPGFHDLETSESAIRGCYSVVTPFEVENLVDGMMTKTLLKRVETCQFWVYEGYLFVTGKGNAQKLLIASLQLQSLGPCSVNFTVGMMQNFRDRLSVVKTLDIQNPKESEIQKAKISGKNIEDYSLVAAPGNHILTSFSGKLETGTESLNISVTDKGVIRIGAKIGFIFDLDTLLWIVSLILDENSKNLVREACQKFESEIKKTGLTVTIGSGEKSITLSKR